MGSAARTLQAACRGLGALSPAVRPLQRRQPYLRHRELRRPHLRRADSENARPPALRLARRARALHADAVPGRGGRAGRHGPSANDHGGDSRPGLARDAEPRCLQLRGLEKAKANFANVGTTPFGYGNPLYNNTGCFTENTPAATCNGNTKEVRQITAGIYDTIYQGNYGTLKAGVQYSYTQRIAFAGVGGAPKTDDNIVMTQIRYYPF